MPITMANYLINPKAPLRRRCFPQLQIAAAEQSKPTAAAAAGESEMSGYQPDYSMSNRAADAYDRGEKPLSRIRKSDLPQDVSVKFFRFLVDVDKVYSDTWHHTSKHFNSTTFWDADQIEEQINELRETGELELLRTQYDSKKSAPADNDERRVAGSYNEWEGSKRYGRFVKYSIRLSNEGETARQSTAARLLGVTA